MSRFPALLIDSLGQAFWLGYLLLHPTDQGMRTFLFVMLFWQVGNALFAVRMLDLDNRKQFLRFTTYCFGGLFVLIGALILLGFFAAFLLTSLFQDIGTSLFNALSFLAQWLWYIGPYCYLPFALWYLWLSAQSWHEHFNKTV
jgi:hypothetical protein